MLQVRRARVSESRRWPWPGLGGPGRALAAQPHRRTHLPCPSHAVGPGLSGPGRALAAQPHRGPTHNLPLKVEKACTSHGHASLRQLCARAMHGTRTAKAICRCKHGLRRPSAWQANAPIGGDVPVYSDVNRLNRRRFESASTPQAIYGHIPALHRKRALEYFCPDAWFQLDCSQCVQYMPTYLPSYPQ
jgi:hypothetical protein